MATKANSDPYLQPRTQPTSNKDTLFLLEVGGICPKCGKPLLTAKGRRAHKLYQIAHKTKKDLPLFQEEDLVFPLQKIT